MNRSDYLTLLSETLLEFQHDGFLCDVLISASDGAVQAHSAVLGAANEHLKVSFQAQSNERFRVDDVTYRHHLDMSECCVSALITVLQSIYSHNECLMIFDHKCLRVLSAMGFDIPDDLETAEVNIGGMSSLLECLTEMQRNGELCDVAVETSDGSVPAHSALLAASSPTLRSLFKQQQEEEGGDETCPLYHVDLFDWICADVVRNLESLYTGVIAETMGEDARRVYMQLAALGLGLPDWQHVTLFSTELLPADAGIVMMDVDGSSEFGSDLSSQEISIDSTALTKHLAVEQIKTDSNDILWKVKEEIGGPIQTNQPSRIDFESTSSAVSYVHSGGLQAESNVIIHEEIVEIRGATARRKLSAARCSILQRKQNRTSALEAQVSARQHEAINSVRSHSVKKNCEAVSVTDSGSLVSLIKPDLFAVDRCETNVGHSRRTDRKQCATGVNKSASKCGATVTVIDFQKIKAAQLSMQNNLFDNQISCGGDLSRVVQCPLSESNDSSLLSSKYFARLGQHQPKLTENDKSKSVSILRLPDRQSGIGSDCAGVAFSKCSEQIISSLDQNKGCESGYVPLSQYRIVVDGNKCRTSQPRIQVVKRIVSNNFGTSSDSSNSCEKNAFNKRQVTVCSSEGDTQYYFIPFHSETISGTVKDEDHVWNNSELIPTADHIDKSLMKTADEDDEDYKHCDVSVPQSGSDTSIGMEWVVGQVGTEWAVGQDDESGRKGSCRKRKKTVPVKNNAHAAVQPAGTRGSCDVVVSQSKFCSDGRTEERGEQRQCSYASIGECTKMSPDSSVIETVPNLDAIEESDGNKGQYIVRYASEEGWDSGQHDEGAKDCIDADETNDGLKRLSDDLMLEQRQDEGETCGVYRVIESKSLDSVDGILEFSEFSQKGIYVELDDEDVDNDDDGEGQDDDDEVVDDNENDDFDSDICHFCKKAFESDEELQEHLRTSHVNELSEIDEAVARDKEFLCSMCGATFMLRALLRDHIQTHHKTNEKSFKCELCSKSFVRISGLRRHRKVEHSESFPFECTVCGRRFAYQCNLKNHAVTHSDDKPFTCETCGLSFRHNINLSKHMRLLHSRCTNCPDNASCTCQRWSKYQCKVCSKSCGGQAQLTVHLRVHTGEKPAVCNVCGQRFQHKSNLEKHRIKHTGSRAFVCEFCPRSFYSKHSLESHARLHTGDSPYQCETCGKRFCTRNGLQVHTLLHSDVRPFVCGTCGKSFAQLGNLNKHLAIHTGARPFKCTKCEMAFVDTSALRRHEVMHTRACNFTCSICSRSFMYLTSLRSHKLTHENVKPHCCKVCGKSFRQKAGYQRHMKIHSNTSSGGTDAVKLNPGEFIVYLTE